MAIRLAAGVMASMACLVLAGAASAQTWEGTRTTPHLAEILVVDATSEAGWPYGSEAVPATADARTVYGALGDSQLWLRFYFSDASEPPAELSTYIFIDADVDPATGGPAIAPDLDPLLTSDPSNGGYEFVVVTVADATAPAVWEWDGAAWVDADLPPNQVQSEIGTDRDAVAFGAASHGYVQTMIDYGTAGLAAACNADFFFRSTSGDGVRANADLEVGEAVPCTPRDTNGDQVPDVLVPPDCAGDDDCPGNGICVDGACFIPVGCAVPADCDPDEDCVAGVCVAQGGDACTEAADCDGLVCDNGTCVACTGDAQCAGGRCAPDGRCVEADVVPPPAGTAGSGPEHGLALEAGDEVRGGACKCQAPGGRALGGAWVALLAGAGLLRRRRVTRR